jgi:hypothetical protein
MQLSFLKVLKKKRNSREQMNSLQARIPLDEKIPTLPILSVLSGTINKIVSSSSLKTIYALIN